MREIFSLVIALSISACSAEFASRLAATNGSGRQGVVEVQEFPVPAGSGPHDVAPATDGSIWYTAQQASRLGNLNPATGEIFEVPLGAGSAPHGVIVGPDSAPWITAGGLNAIVRVDPRTLDVQVFPLPPEWANAGLNTATFDLRGALWFTGESGVYGRLDSGKMEVFPAPRGPGAYGICTTPQGDVYFASLASSYIARIDLDSGEATVLDPPTSGQGARRVWSDSLGRIWVSEWNAGQLALYDPSTNEWREWPVHSGTQTYAVFVDDGDFPWVSDWGANAIERFDPSTEEFEVFPLPSSPANVRQLLGRPGEVWGAESAANKLVVIRTQ